VVSKTLVPGQVDIILPTYRRPHTIGYAIEAVRRQTYASWQLHVIGDGSNEATTNVVRAFTDSRIHFHWFPKAHGFGYAHRNTVLRQTNGEFVAYATDDDLWFPEHLAMGIEALGSGLDLAAFRSAHVAFPDHLNPYFFAYDWRSPSVEWLLRWFVGAVECVHRRSVFDTVGYWNDELFRFGDREFHNRVRRSGLPTRYFDMVTVLRFYAMHWDAHYAEGEAPPQEAYLDRIGDTDWTGRLRESARPGRRSPRVRRDQIADFMRFGMKSGPKFARFWWQKWRSTPGSNRG
jgi:glycosyltransferase involved in cell wall biosynthesis